MTGFVLRGSLVISADEPVCRDGGVLVSPEGRVVAAGAWGDVARVAGPAAEVLDLRPNWIAPGMIDLHVHLTLPGDGGPAERHYAQNTAEALLLIAEHNAVAALRAGVTTMRDCGGATRVVIGLRDAIRRGLILGPRLFVAGTPMTITGGHMSYIGGEVDSVDEIRRYGRQLLKQGVDFLKMAVSGGGTPGAERISTAFTVEEVRAAREEAKRFGKHLAVHASNLLATRLAVEAGVDTLEHCIFTTPDRDDYFDAEIAEALAKSGTVVSPTLTPMLGTIRLLQAKQAEGRLTPEDAATLSSMSHRTEVKVKNCRRLMEMGVQVASSTDAGWRINHFGDYADCLEILARAGASSLEVFRSATLVPARALNRSGELGHLRPGAWTDAVVLRENPLEDVRAVRDVVAVYLGGQKVERQQTELSKEG